MRRRVTAAAASELPLICPGCGERFGDGARFCESCGLPVIRPEARAGAVSERHERARKIKPQLAEGPLRYVAHAHNQAEGEFIQGLLLEEGVPSLLRRSAGFDVPDFLAAGPRDVLVAESGYETARQLLRQADVIAEEEDSWRVSPSRLLAGLLIALAFGALLVWLFSLAVR